MVNKSFKIIKPGGASLLTKQESVTPEIFILQLDLLASCASDIGLTGRVCPLYQVVFNVVRFAASTRIQRKHEAKLLKEIRVNMGKEEVAKMMETAAKKKLDRLTSDASNVANEDGQSDESDDIDSQIAHLPKNMSLKVHRSQIFVKLLKVLSDHDPPVNQVMYSIVTEKPWSDLVLPMQLMNVFELTKLKSQYMKYREIKNRQITDFMSVMQVFGHMMAEDKTVAQ